MSECDTSNNIIEGKKTKQIFLYSLQLLYYMHANIRKVIVSLHISSVLCIVAIISLFTFLSNIVKNYITISVILLILAILQEILIIYLKKENKWSWIITFLLSWFWIGWVVIGNFYLISPIVIMGMYNMWKLGDKEVRKEYGTLNFIEKLYGAK
jgi:hypothetical protein